jgi:hypothetical protein
MMALRFAKTSGESGIGILLVRTAGAAAVGLQDRSWARARAEGQRVEATRAAWVDRSELVTLLDPGATRVSGAWRRWDGL